MRFGLNKHTHTNTVQFPGLECHFQRVQLDCASINKLKQYFHLRDLQKFKNCPTASKVLDKKYAIVRKYVALSLIWAVCERVKFFPSIQDLFSKKKEKRKKKKSVPDSTKSKPAFLPSTNRTLLILHNNQNLPMPRKQKENVSYYSFVFCESNCNRNKLENSVS